MREKALEVIAEFQRKLKGKESNVKQFPTELLQTISSYLTERSGKDASTKSEIDNEIQRRRDNEASQRTIFGWLLVPLSWLWSLFT